MLQLMNLGFALRKKGKRKAGVAGAAFRLSALHPTHEALRCAVRLCSHRAAAVTAQGSQTEQTATNALFSALFTSGVACPPAASPSVSASHGQAPSGTAPSRAPSRAPQEGPVALSYHILLCCSAAGQEQAHLSPPSAEPGHSPRLRQLKHLWLLSCSLPGS